MEPPPQVVGQSGSFCACETGRGKRQAGRLICVHRADEHRHRAFEIKIRQVAATGAEHLAPA